MPQKEKSLEDELYRAGCFLLLIVGIAIFLYFKVILPKFPVIPCMFYEMLGIYCPGCGGTRAFGALLKGRLLQSLWYHPLVLYAVVVYGGFMVTQSLERLHIPRIKGWKFHTWYLYGAIVVIFFNFIIKNILLLCCHITL